MSDSNKRPPALKAAITAFLAEYGGDAVKREVAAQTRKKAGRRLLPDWSLLHEQLQADARRLLDGESYAVLTNTEIARHFADRHPQAMTSRPAIKKRIKRKLDRRRDLYVLYNAFIISKAERPWWQHIAVTETLAHADKELGDLWRAHRERQATILCHWIELHGQPDGSSTFEAIADCQTLRPPSPGGMMPRQATA